MYRYRVMLDTADLPTEIDDAWANTRSEYNYADLADTWPAILVTPYPIVELVAGDRVCLDSNDPDSICVYSTDGMHARCTLKHWPHYFLPIEGAASDETGIGSRLVGLYQDDPEEYHRLAAELSHKQGRENALSVLFEDPEMGMRAYNALVRNHITTLEEVEAIVTGRMVGIRGLGVGLKEQLLNALNFYRQKRGLTAIVVK